MAWRDARRRPNRLLMVATAIVLGVASLVAVNTFRANLQADIDDEARTLLGADLVVRTNRAPDPQLLAVLDSLTGIADRAQEVNFASMALFPDSGSRLVQVRALSGGFPFYGEIETQPAGGPPKLLTPGRTLADPALLLQFNVRDGDSIRLGNRRFAVAGRLLAVPGQAGITATVAPPVYIPYSDVDATGLLARGSRIVYLFYFMTTTPEVAEQLAKALTPKLEPLGATVESVEGRKARLGQAFGQLVSFLNLTGFVALLLGCAGLAGAVQVYAREKVSAVAVLRTLGATGGQAFRIYLIQIAVVGLGGGLLGALLGSAVQVALPAVIGQFLPLDVRTTPSLAAIIEGVAVGGVAAVLFGLLPLLRVRRVSPLRTLRLDLGGERMPTEPLRPVVIVALVAAILGYTRLQTGSWLVAGLFGAGVAVAFGVLATVATVLMWLTRTVLTRALAGRAYILRQSLCNLYRPQNQTLLLVTTIGLGVFLQATLLFVQGGLLQQVSLSGTGTQPNLVVFDIQNSQRQGVEDFLRQNNLPLLQRVPVVALRLEAVNGQTRSQYEALRQADASAPGPAPQVFDREYQATFRDTLNGSESISDGEWRGTVGPDGVIYVSVSDFIARSWGIGPGTRMRFNVQGAPLDVTVGSIRSVRFSSLQPAFGFVFPRGVLEPAPQFHVMLTRTPGDSAAAAFQRGLLQRYPNLSVVDLKFILQTATEILDQVSFVIRFMALFSILTGVLVLMGAVWSTRSQRIRENALLRTLGAQRRQVFTLAALEYGFVGLLAGLTGTALGLGAALLLGRYFFSATVIPEPWALAVLPLAAAALTAAVGLASNYGALLRSPLDVLRQES